jgi:gluconolactonase
MAPSRNLNSTITKIDFFSASDHNRDKVRTPDHTYMVKSGCAWKTGVVLCAQGTLKEPAALIFMDSTRPHRHFPLLTNFNGIPLNSPSACIAHADGSLWFSDPHLHHSPNFRPRPRLPPMIYRFDPASSDLRAMCSDIAHPTALAFAPDYKAMYVLDGTPPPSSQSAPVPLANTTPILYAFTVSCFGNSKAPFLTHKRLFAFTTSPPTSVTTDSKGNVYVGCLDGVHVFSVGGSLIGRIVVEGGVTGLCFGRTGELWVSANEKIWRVQLQPGLGGSVPRNHD